MPPYRPTDTRAQRHEANIRAKADRGMACLRRIVEISGADPTEPMEERAAWRFLQRELIGKNNPVLWGWIRHIHRELYPAEAAPSRFNESRERLFQLLVHEIERLEAEAANPATEADIFKNLTD